MLSIGSHASYYFSSIDSGVQACVNLFSKLYPYAVVVHVRPIDRLRHISYWISYRDTHWDYPRTYTGDSLDGRECVVVDVGYVKLLL